jgi:hypothetical protein
MIRFKLKFAVAEVLAAGFAVAGLGLVPRGAPGAPSAAAAAENSPAADDAANRQAAAQKVERHPPMADAAPNFLNFGSVRVGATVEGSVRVFRDAPDANGLAIKIDPPAFVRVEDIKIGSQDYGGNRRGYCDLSLSLDTERAGSCSGDLRLEFGRQRVAIPVSATVRPQMPLLTRLLVVQTPFTKFSTSDATIFAAWLDLIGEGHFDVHYLTSQHGLPVIRKIDLAKIDVVLIGTEGLFGAQESDIKLLKQFTEGGGRTVVAANYFFRGTVAKANELLVPYGLRMADTESRDRREFDLRVADIVDDPLTEGVKKLHFQRPSPVAVTDTQKGKILVRTPDHPDEGFVAAAQAGQGQVVALGQSLWWQWIAKDHAKGSDNAALLGNLLKKSQRRK